MKPNMKASREMSKQYLHLPSGLRPNESPAFGGSVTGMDKQKEKELEVNVSASIEEGLPQDHEISRIAELLSLKVRNALKYMVEDGCADNAIPLPNVTGNILAKVIEYCKKHVEEGATDAEKDKSGDEIW